MEKPECCTVEMLNYLDDLRESGRINMFGAAPYLELDFGISKSEAKDVLIYWMETFDKNSSRER